MEFGGSCYWDVGLDGVGLDLGKICYVHYLVWGGIPANVELHGLSLIYPIQSSDLSHLLPQQDLTSMLARFLKEKYHAHYDPAETPEATSGGFCDGKPCLDCWVSQDNLQFTIVYHSNLENYSGGGFRIYSGYNEISFNGGLNHQSWGYDIGHNMV